MSCFGPVQGRWVGFSWKSMVTEAKSKEKEHLNHKVKPLKNGIYHGVHRVLSVNRKSLGTS